MISNVFKRFTNFLGDNHKKRLFENFVSLSVLRAANYLLPLITLPYLVRVLGAEMFGLVMFAYAFNQYFVIFTDFGFNLSATPAVSRSRDNPKELSEIFWSVTIIKTGFLITGFIILSGLVYVFDKFRSDYLLYLLSYGFVIGQSLFPVWFFQGMERMKFVTALNITAKLIFTLLLFVVIREPSDYIYYPIINSLGILVASIISIYLVIYKFKVKFIVPKPSVMIFRLRESSHFFVSRAAVAFYTNSNTFIVGLVLGNVAAGFYAAAEKIFIAITALYTPLVDSLYPFMSKRKEIKTYKKIFAVASLGNLALCLLVYLFSSQIVFLIFGSDFETSAPLVRLFALQACIVVPSVMLGYPLLGAMGYPAYANYSAVVAAVVHILMLAAFVPVLTLQLVVVLSIITQMVVLTIRVVGVRTKLGEVWKGQP